MCTRVHTYTHHTRVAYTHARARRHARESQGGLTHPAGGCAPPHTPRMGVHKPPVPKPHSADLHMCGFAHVRICTVRICTVRICTCAPMHSADLHSADLHSAILTKNFWGFFGGKNWGNFLGGIFSIRIFWGRFFWEKNVCGCVTEHLPYHNGVKIAS